MVASLLQVFFLLIGIIDACTKIIIKSNNPSINWIEGTFMLDPTLVADGRPVYIESFVNETAGQPKRYLYHYSHDQDIDPSQYAETDFSGRWILGNSIFSPNGWLYISSWSISPSDNMISSLLNAQSSNDDYAQIAKTKSEWRLYADNKWQFDSTKQVELICDTQYEDITQDWLFISTPNRFEFNILNNRMDAGASGLHSITDVTLYGFYYRISDTFWRKVESKMYFHRQPASHGYVECSFFYYDAPTLENGIPDLESFDGNKIVTYASSSKKLTYLNDKEWYFENHRRESNLERELVSIDITIADDMDDDIYKAFRRKWKGMKTNSFESVMKSDLQKNKMIKDTNNGMPFMMLGLGTGGLPKYAAKQSQEWALNDIGYKLIDGAEAYENEMVLGDILSQNKARDDVYITSKVWPTNLGFVQTYEAILQSMNKVKTNYFDLYMIHWNRCDPNISWMHCEQASNRPWGQSWQIMEKLYAEGYLHSLGISNYDFNTVKREILDSRDLQIVPQVIQNYFDISHADWDLAEFVNKYGIIYQGYAQYRGIAQSEERAKHGETHYARFKHKLDAISSRVSDGKASASQILLRWLLEKNVAVIPRSSKENHLRDNLNLWDFELAQKDIEELTSMSIDQNMKQRKGEL